MNALGNTFYLFCSKGIVVGDSKLQNYMYNGSQAVRIDLIFNFSSLHILDWNEINQDLELAKEKSEELWKLVDEGECIFRDIAATLTHRPQSTRRFCNNLEAFLQGYVNDSLSKNLAYVFQKIANGLIPYIQKAEKESKPFEGVYWSDKFTKMQKSTGKVTIRWFDH